MTIEEFQKFIDEQDALFRSVKTASQSERERVLARTVKISDVVITTFLLAKSMDVDVMRTIGRKVEKIREKHNKQLT